MITFLRNLVAHDFWLKLFSLVLAFLIWLIVWKAIGKGVSPLAAFTNPTPEQNYVNVPVLVRLPAADIRNVKVDPTEVRITVRGEAKLLRDLQPRDIRAEVDLTGIESARGLHKRD